jgi:membrane protease YdiL (CAAX protease family)
VNADATKFGPLQGLWLVLGYVLAQLTGNFLAYLAWGVGTALDALLHHRPLSTHPVPTAGVLALATLLGFALSAAWSYLYIRRRARPQLRQGGAGGIGWCAPTSRRAWFAAVAVALFCMVFAGAMVLALPPDPDKLNGPLSKLLAAPGLPRLAVTLLAVCGAPVVEEFLFRGALFAALARRWSVLMAGSVTTLVFVALHAADKLGWWPGFLVVGLLGTLLLLLRIRYRSLWPGILAHFLYNSSFFFLP